MSFLQLSWFVNGFEDEGRGTENARVFAQGGAHDGGFCGKGVDCPAGKLPADRLEQGLSDLRYAAEHITSQDDSVTLMVGVDTQVVHGFVNCNATGAITGVGNALPREVLHLVTLSQQAAKGDAKARRLARELESALAVLSSFDEGCDLVLYYKYLMVLNGDKGYDLHFNATDVLSDAQRRYAEQQFALFRQWYANWSAEQHCA
jgi:4-hydroxy-tetrahydrodipicolinate synthase